MHNFVSILKNNGSYTLKWVKFIILKKEKKANKQGLPWKVGDTCFLDQESGYRGTHPTLPCGFPWSLRFSAFPFPQHTRTFQRQSQSTAPESLRCVRHDSEPFTHSIAWTLPDLRRVYYFIAKSREVKQLATVTQLVTNAWATPVGHFSQGSPPAAPVLRFRIWCNMSIHTSDFFPQTFRSSEIVYVHANSFLVCVQNANM